MVGGTAMFKRQIRELEEYPTGYGVAYVDFMGRYFICYPIPLNLVVALWRRALQWLRHGHQLYRTGYDDGFETGYADGTSHVREMVRDHLERRGD